MSDKEKNILSALKEHSVAPPSFLFDKIKNRIEEEDNVAFKRTMEPLAAHSVKPANDFFEKNILPGIHSADKRIDDKLKTLRDHKVVSPTSFEKIMAAIRNNRTGKVVNGSFIKKLAAAAAVIIICTTAYFIYEKNNKISGTDNIAKIAPGNRDSKTTDPSLPSTVEIASAKPDSIINDNIKKQYAKNNTRSRESGTLFSASQYVAAKPVISIEGSNFPVTDNDYLATFASFNESTVPAFLRADKPVATLITVDKYTSITVSEGMAAIMKKMYKVRKNGKPTRRARKQREKLEKWKKADADFFNQNSTKNPLDPIDLGELILYK